MRQSDSFADVDLHADEQNHTVSHDLATQFSTVDLDDTAQESAQKKPLPPSKSSRDDHPIDSSNSNAATTTADQLLDELSDHALSRHQTSMTGSSFPMEISRSTSSTSGGPGTGLHSPEWLADTRQTYHYDQFFEEVSLDLPRDTPSHPYDQSSPSKLLKFMPRRPTSESRPNPLSISSADISGPFYSISDVLSDNPSTKPAVAAVAAAGREIGDGRMGDATSAASRGARRNIYETDIVVTSGGSSAKGVKRRNSLNPFSRSKPSQQKPSPLEVAVSKTRPRMLPPKDPYEEKKHLQQHQMMMKKAKQLEIKKEKENYRRREEKDRMLSQAIHIWETEILPNWDIKVRERRTHELWLQGIPPRCRRKVWKRAIGNGLKLPEEAFAQYLHRVPPSTKTAEHGTMKRRTSYQGQAAASRTSFNSDCYSEHSDRDWKARGQDQNVPDTDDLYTLRRVRRTSSLNVLHEEDGDRVSYADSVHDSTAPSHYPLEDIPSQSFEGSEEYSDNGNGVSAESRCAMELEDPGENGVAEHDNDKDVRVGDDIGSSEDEDEALGSDLDENEAAIYLSKSVDEDIIRTLPSLCVFQRDGPLFGSLRKVLHAYLAYRENTTYHRGTSFLAGMLLLNMGAQDSFTALANLIQKSGVLTAFYDSDERRVKGYFKIFNVVFAENLPKLYLHFKNLSLTPDHYLADWFMTIFSSTIPLELSSRLWDIFLLEGDIILFKASLAILKYLEPLLWGGNFGETVKVLNMGFVGEERGEEVKAAFAVAGKITRGEQGEFFNEVLGRNGLQLDRFKFRELVTTHVTLAG